MHKALTSLLTFYEEKDKLSKTLVLCIPSIGKVDNKEELLADASLLSNTSTGKFEESIRKS